MTSFIHVSQLTPSDLARLGNNVRPPRRHPAYDPVRQSLAIHEPDYGIDDDRERDEAFALAVTAEPELSDALRSA